MPYRRHTGRTSAAKAGRLLRAELPADLGPGHAESVLLGSLVSLKHTVTPLGS
jgi:hypothetical protein